jgi:hypothetical protein
MNDQQRSFTGCGNQKTHINIWVRAWNFASSFGGGSGPSDPRLTNIIGNCDSRKLVKIRNIAKLAKDFVFGF